MVGRLSDCVLLAYRTPVDSVRTLVPPGLQLVTVGPWAFWNVVACRVERMRPRAVPGVLGLSYHHVAYRLYVTCATARGPLSGLYFVRSDADSRLIASAGNALSDFRFHPARIDLRVTPNRVAMNVLSFDGAGDATLEVESAAAPTLAAESPFATVEDAARVLKYQPLAMSVADNRVRLAEVRRHERHWRESPVTVTSARWSFFDRLGQQPNLERATRVDAIDYEWRLGATAELAAGATSAPG